MRLVCSNFSTIRTWHSPSSQMFAWLPWLDISHVCHAKYTEGASISPCVLHCLIAPRHVGLLTLVDLSINVVLAELLPKSPYAAHTWRTKNCKPRFLPPVRLIFSFTHASNLFSACPTDEEDSKVGEGKTRQSFVKCCVVQSNFWPE